MVQREGPPGALPVKPEPPAQGFQPGGQRLAVEGGEARGEADVIEPAVIVVKTQQQGADRPGAGRIAEAAHDAIGRAKRVYASSAQLLSLDRRLRKPPMAASVAMLMKPD